MRLRATHLTNTDQEDRMLYRTGPSTPALGLRRELDRLMDETLGRMGTETGSWGPAMDIVEDADGLLIELELPGLTPEEVEITTEKGVLTIRGEKRTVRQREGVRAITTERAHGRFTRAVQLPQGVDEAKIDAEFEHGLLRVRVPRAALPQPRRVEIRTAAQDGQPAVNAGPSPDGATARDEMASR
jgi:HSP20 family protein